MPGRHFRAECGRGGTHHRIAWAVRVSCVLTAPPRRPTRDRARTAKGTGPAGARVIVGVAAADQLGLRAYRHPRQRPDQVMPKPRRRPRRRRAATGGRGGKARGLSGGRLPGRMHGVCLAVIDRQDLAEARGIQDPPGLRGRRRQGQTAGCGANRPPDLDEDPGRARTRRAPAGARVGQAAGICVSRSRSTSSSAGIQRARSSALRTSAT
jgi:hypothetical protein